MFRNTFIAAGIALASSAAVAQNIQTYEVTITNLTPGQTFTPQMVLTHSADFRMFELGEPASLGLEALAEGGNPADLIDEAANFSIDAQVGDGLLGPGETVTIEVRGRRGQGSYLSVAAMLIPTNDTFMALSALPLPNNGMVEVMLSAYDAGTEANDQNCANMPGPRCGGEGTNLTPSDDDEGFVHVSNGFHELGDEDDQGNEILGPRVYDWRGTVAKVTVRPRARFFGVGF